MSAGQVGTAMRERLLRMEDVSEWTGVPVSTLRYWRLRDQGEGPASGRLGARVVYRESAVQTWIDAQLSSESA